MHINDRQWLIDFLAARYRSTNQWDALLYDVGLTVPMPNGGQDSHTMASHLLKDLEQREGDAQDRPGITSVGALVLRLLASDRLGMEDVQRLAAIIVRNGLLRDRSLSNLLDEKPHLAELFLERIRAANFSHADLRTAYRLALPDGRHTKAVPDTLAKMILDLTDFQVVDPVDSRFPLTRFFAGLFRCVMPEAPITQRSSSTDGAFNQGYIILMIDSASGDDEQFLVKAWLFINNKKKKNLCTGKFHPKSQLPNAVSEIIDSAKKGLSNEQFAESQQQLIVEVFLPIAILVQQLVEQWRYVNSIADYGFVDRSLLTYHPVVTRSLDRLKSKETHGDWKRRWTKLKQDAMAGEVKFYISEGEIPDEGFGNSAHCATVLTYTTIKEELCEQLIDILSRGYPVVIWSNSERNRHIIKDEVDHLERHNNMMALPHIFFHYRTKGASLCGMSDLPKLNDFCRLSTLLWDDPYRLPPDTKRDTLKSNMKSTMGGEK